MVLVPTPTHQCISASMPVPRLWSQGAHDPIESQGTHCRKHTHPTGSWGWEALMPVRGVWPGCAIDCDVPHIGVKGSAKLW